MQIQHSGLSSTIDPALHSQRETLETRDVLLTYLKMHFYSSQENPGTQACIEAGYQRFALQVLLSFTLGSEQTGPIAGGLV